MVAHKQQGMALLMALVMLAIAMTLAAGIWYNSRLSLFRTHNLQQSMQAQHLGRGLLVWASDILEKDYAEAEQAADNNMDAWHQGIQGLIVEQAVLSGDLIGMNHVFNVNNLVIDQQVSEVHVTYFKRLLTALNLDPQIADKAIDWIDSDQQPRQGGAEDFSYAGESPPYKTAGKAFLHVNQLRLLATMDDQQFQRLLPYVGVLPVTNGATKMNINSLPAIMIRALDNEIEEKLALRIYQQGQANFTQLDAFFQFEEMKFRLGVQERRDSITQLIGVKTRFLQAKTQVDFKESSHIEYALLQRDNSGASRVLMRSSVPFIDQTLLH